MKDKINAAQMIDISAKSMTKRQAIALGYLNLSIPAFRIFLKEGSPKGDVYRISEIAGLMGAKKTAEILPLCHPLSLQKVQVVVNLEQKKRRFRVQATVNCLGQTGVEMEALTAVSISCLCLYDMLKCLGQEMTISDIHLVSKTGGKSGDYYDQRR